MDSKSISVGLIYREEIDVPILFPLPSENPREKSWNVDLSWFSSFSPDHRGYFQDPFYFLPSFAFPESQAASPFALLQEVVSAPCLKSDGQMLISWNVFQQCFLRWFYCLYAYEYAFLNNRFGSVEIQRVMPDVSTGTLLSDALQLLTSAAS